jgi:hypothetical protein
MIKTVGQFLQALIEREAASLARQKIQHGPTIGAMYEGLTQSVLKRTLPINAPLSVVSGFAVGADGAKSRQLDCMVVVGDGTAIPYTNTFEYRIDQVLIVVEVKKALTQACFDEAFENLRSLRLKRFTELPFPYEVESAFERISGRPFPDDVNTMTDLVLRQLLHQLVKDVESPVRILLGYEGYKTVGGLRRGIGEQLARLVGKYGAGPSSLPDLVLTRKAAVVKANGFPYVGPMDDAGKWPVFVSVASESPALTFLEVVWTRLQGRVGGSSEIFGDDLAMASLVKLAEYLYLPGRGWEVMLLDTVPEKDLHAVEEEWEPTFLSDPEHVLVTFLCRHKEIDMAAPPDGFDTDEVRDAIARLTSVRLIGAESDRPTVSRLLTTECAVAALPDGRVAAGENNSGRLRRWVEKFMSDRKQGK